MLVVFTAAMVGVLVEAFAPRAYRAAIQLWLSLLALATAFGLIIWNAVDGTNALVGGGAVAIAPPALFFQGTIVVLSFAAVLLMAERSLDPAGDAFSPMPAAA